MKNWSREKRTAVQVVLDEITRRYGERGAKTRAAHDINMDPHHFAIWIREPGRGLAPENTRKVARFFGLPFEAVVFKHEPVGSVVRGAPCSCCGRDRRRAAA